MNWTEYELMVVNGYEWYFGSEVETPMHIEAKRVRVIARFYAKQKQ